jgi:hypothetical protein
LHEQIESLKLELDSNLIKANQDNGKLLGVLEEKNKKFEQAL